MAASSQTPLASGGFDDSEWPPGVYCSYLTDSMLRCILPSAAWTSTS